MKETPAHQFLDEHWPEAWPEYDGEGVAFYDSILKEWEQEYKAAILDRWIEFCITHQIKQKAAVL